MKKLFTLLTLLVALVTSAWADPDYTYSIAATASETNLAASGDTYSTSVASSSTSLKNKTMWVEVPSATSQGLIVFYGNSAANDRFLYIYKTNGTVKDDTRKIVMAAGWNAAADAIYFTADDILTNGGKYYLVFGTSDDYKIKGVKYTLVTPHKVTYKANGGTGDDVINNAAISIAANTFTAPTGKVFWKWNTSADGSGTDYAVGTAPTEDLTLYAQWGYEKFSMTSVTAPTDNVSSKTSSDVTATFNAGSSATIYNAKSSAAAMVSSAKEIDLGGSSSSYFCATFTTALQEGDVLLCPASSFKISATSSSPTAVTFPFMIPAEHALIGKTSVYVFKNTDSKFASFSIVRPAVTPTFSLVSTSIAANETTQIQVGSKGNLDGITFDGDVTFGTAGVVTVDAAGVVTPVAAGTTTINFNTNAVREYYASAGNSLSITVTAAKTETTLSFGSPTTIVARGAEVTNAASLTETVGGAAVAGTIVYSSDDPTIATVDATGKVTGVKVGTTTIRANYAGDATYAAATEVTYDVTVSLPVLTTVSNKIWNSNDAAWTALAGDITATDVVDNMEIVATASKKMTIKAGQSSQTHADFASGFTSRIQTLGKPGSDNDARYLHFKAAANSYVSAYFIRGTEGAETAGYSLGTLDSENPTGTYTNSGSGVDKMTFITGNSETDVYLYSASETGGKGVQFVAVKVVPSVSVSTLDGRNYASCVPSYKLDFASAEGITAYIATGLNGAEDAVELQAVDVVPAGTPIIVKTDTKGATVNVPVTDAAASDVSGNKLIAGDGTTAWNGTSGYKYYYLASDQFHEATSGTLQSGKAYLKVSTTAAPVLNINFGETTGIDSVKASEFKANGEYYNLAGQRVAQPTKGLYIVNGRKVIVK